MGPSADSSLPPATGGGPGVAGGSYGAPNAPPNNGESPLSSPSLVTPLSHPAQSPFAIPALLELQCRLHSLTAAWQTRSGLLVVSDVYCVQ